MQAVVEKNGGRCFASATDGDAPVGRARPERARAAVDGMEVRIATAGQGRATGGVHVRGTSETPVGRRLPPASPTVPPSVLFD